MDEDAPVPLKLPVPQITLTLTSYTYWCPNSWYVCGSGDCSVTYVEQRVGGAYSIKRLHTHSEQEGMLQVLFR